MKQDTFTALNKLAELCLNIANFVDRRAENDKQLSYLDELGLGYRAFDRYMRDGVKAIVDIQEMYSKAKAQTDLAKIGQEEANAFLEDIFGDREICTVPDEYKEELKALVKELDGEDGSEESEVPRTDVTPMVDAHWEASWDMDEYEYRCSNCKMLSGYGYKLSAGHPDPYLSSYCPSCGAKMGTDGEKGE